MLKMDECLILISVMAIWNLRFNSLSQVHISEDLRTLVRTRCRQVQRDTMPISLPVIKEVSIQYNVDRTASN